jgi:tetratricopeptide (TPR) repeat protein
MFEELPTTTEVLAALQRPFYAEGNEVSYLDALYGVLDVGDPMVLRKIGDTLLRVGQPTELLERLEAAGPYPGVASESERLVQVARARTALSDPEGGLEAVRRARAMDPENPRFAQQEGDTALEAGMAEAAMAAYREALAILAPLNPRPERRAMLHRKIGQAEELRGRMDRAYDAYKLALSIDPDEAFARRRIEEMEAAAGVRPIAPPR